MDPNAPGDISSRLDSFLDAVNTPAVEVTTEPDTADDVESQQANAATDVLGDDANAVYDDTSSDETDSLDANAPGDEADTANATADAVDASPDEWAGVPPAVRERVERAERMAAEAASREEERRIAEQTAKADEQYQQWQARLADMDPEDAKAEVIKVLADGYGGLLREKQTQQITQQNQQQFQQQHSAALEFVASGHRVQPTGRYLQDGQPEYRRVDAASKPLTDAERRIVEKITGGPLQMQQAADEIVAMRTGQTAAARQALAEKRRANGGTPAIGNGRQGAGGAKPDAPEYDKMPTRGDKLDALLDFHNANHGGPLARSAS